MVKTDFGQAGSGQRIGQARLELGAWLSCNGRGEPISRSPPNHSVALGKASRNVRTISACSNALPGETHWTMIPFGASERATSLKYSTEYRLVAPASYGCTTSAVTTS